MYKQFFSIFKARTTLHDIVGKTLDSWPPERDFLAHAFPLFDGWRLPITIILANRRYRTPCVFCKTFDLNEVVRQKNFSRVYQLNAEAIRCSKVVPPKIHQNFQTPLAG